MNNISINRLFIGSVIVTCISLLIYALLYLISGDVNDYFFRFIGFFVAQSLLIGFHFWVRNILIRSDFQKIIFLLVKVELGLSMVALIPLFFSWIDFSRAIILFVVLQIIHGVLYFGNMYLFDEEKSAQTNLSNEEILDLSKRAMHDPSSQDGE